MASFLHTWLVDFRNILCREVKGLFTDAGVLLIFFVGGLGYPLLYNLVYHNGVIPDTPVAVVDLSDSPESRRFIREVDATRELKVQARCVSMEEAEKLMQERKVNGILFFPEDFSTRIVSGETAKLSIYADMSSFIYYKNLLMGTNFVMLDEIHGIEISRLSSAGLSGEQIFQTVSPLPYEENNPWNRAFSYTIFFISAALLLVVQQTMFYGMTLRVGTMREEHDSFVQSADVSRGIGRIVLGRGAAYWLIYMCIAMYVAYIVPAIFNIPQRGDFFDILVLLLVFVADCVLFCEFWSSFFWRRETVIVLLLFMSPVAMFLTGFSWPETAFPAVWKYFSYIFPTTFGSRAFIDLNTAGASLEAVSSLMKAMVIQAGVYYLLSIFAVAVEHQILYIRSHRIAR